MEKKFEHLGHLVLNCFRTRPNAICQIDACTGESETNASVLSRSIKVANALCREFTRQTLVKIVKWNAPSFGLVPGDVVAHGGTNHLDLHIPYYAALFNAFPLVGVDPQFKYDEIKSLLKLTSPKIAFCDLKDYAVYERVVRDLGLNMEIVTFGGGPKSMEAFVQAHGTDEKEEDFKLAEFDPESVFMWLISTSGTTGEPKVAAFKHDVWYKKALFYMSLIKPGEIGEDNVPALNLSPVHWVSGFFNPVGMPLLGQTVVQTRRSDDTLSRDTVEHVIDIINQYKPQQMLINPSTMAYILDHEKKCDLTCFKSIIVGGSKVPANLITELRTRLRPGARGVEMHGQTEAMGPVLFPTPLTPPASCGGPIPLYQVQLMDPETEEVITEPNVSGELCVKGYIFQEYYNNPEETAKSFTKDGWYKTGDLMYRDESNNYYCADRIKMLIKYQTYHVVPGELEEVIRRHPGVAEAVVLGAPHRADGERPAACIVLREGATVTKDEIHQLVANNLSEKKQLRGGILFLKKLPLTSTGKIALKEVKEIVLNGLPQTD